MSWTLGLPDCVVVKYKQKIFVIGSRYREELLHSFSEGPFLTVQEQLIRL